jgi:hypothetical protein
LVLPFSPFFPLCVWKRDDLIAWLEPQSPNSTNNNNANMLISTFLASMSIFHFVLNSEQRRVINFSKIL